MKLIVTIVQRLPVIYNFQNSATGNSVVPWRKVTSLIQKCFNHFLVLWEALLRSIIPFHRNFIFTYLTKLEKCETLSQYFWLGIFTGLAGIGGK